MELNEIPKFFWSDSTTAIAWIKRNDNWGTFVGNRVKRILEITNDNQWRHVPGSLNPADLPSRGCNPKELIDSKWWEGPNWLKLSEEHWPNNELKFNEIEINGEKKKSTINLISLERTSWFDCQFTSYASNVRVMGWIQRFCNNSRRKKDGISHPNPSTLRLSITKMRKAEVHLIKVIQFESKVNDDKHFKKFNLIVGDDGIIRLRTPITKRVDSVGLRLPYLLSRSHPLVRRLIMETHLQFGHPGVQFIMGKLREKYWITQTRKTVSSVINECKKCRRFTAKKMTVSTTSLPEKRVTSGEIFDTTVNLFGPLFLKNNKKVWVVLYTCAVYRAVQLDVINSLSVQAFVPSLKRFIYAFGRPNMIMSDNGTNFVGTANVLKLIDRKELLTTCESEKIVWQFNPPSAPWWSGFWERMVRSVKTPLRSMLGKKTVTFEELTVVLMEIVSVINDRPLTTVTENPNDLEPLTPNMFLRGTKMATFPEEEAMITNLSLQKQWRRIKDLNERLQKRFRKEYLGQLMEHSKSPPSSEINVGDIVLVGSDNKKRLSWPMARVLELMTGVDNVVRTVKLKTKFGCLIRPVQRLYPLEMSTIHSIPLIPNDVRKLQGDEEPEETQPENDDEPEDQEVVKRTRSGRIIKKPLKLRL